MCGETDSRVIINYGNDRDDSYPALVAAMFYPNDKLLTDTHLDGGNDYPAFPFPCFRE